MQEQKPSPGPHRIGIRRNLARRRGPGIACRRFDHPGGDEIVDRRPDVCQPVEAAGNEAELQSIPEREDHGIDPGRRRLH
ncbi:MAG TPA: hypothetical protein DCG14_07415, partial [Phycisphaerales bacterium]|nr:hypothetical protein [Phycisphaerales bacterium]